MPTLPFLYLPDAVTLILLLVVLAMLRSAAICHLRQELLIIRKEMLSFWLDRGLDHADRGYSALNELLSATIRFAPRFSPARLLFIHRLKKKTLKQGRLFPLPDPARDARLLIDRTADGNGREKLIRLQMELNLSLGTFFLVGSLSGWVLFSAVVYKMAKRSIADYQDHRIDVFFDMAERVLGRIGRQALMIGLAGQHWRALRHSQE